MTIKLIEDKELWDTFVDESNYGLLYHKWDFLNIIEKHSSYKLLPYGIYKGDELIAISPLFYKKRWGLKTIFSPPPQTGVPYLGFIVNKEYDNLKQNKKEGISNLIANELDEEIKKISPNYVSISTVPNFIDIRHFKWNNYNIDIRFTYVINLNFSLDEILANFKRSLRSKIKLSERLKFKLLKSNDFSIFWELQKARYEEQGLNLPLISENYLKELVRAYPKNIGLYYLYNNNEDLLGAAITQEYKIFSAWQGFTKMSKPHEDTNKWIIWKLIQKAKSENYQKFELTGANTKHLCQFKSKFNPSLEFCFNIYKKDILGKISEWGYFHFIKRKWI